MSTPFTYSTRDIAHTITALDSAMTPIKSRMQVIVAIDQKKQKHSEATKKGMESWIMYLKMWLKILEQFPDEFKTYHDKVKHISQLWQLRKKSIKDREKSIPFIKRQHGFHRTTF
tara:strand:- start:504 stop:848 length:345 start_codon:yes stop_codon:yes gene_type:complete